MPGTEVSTPSRRIVCLYADWATSRALYDWCHTVGFDLGWSFSGWPQHSDYFAFHVTVIATSNKVKIELGSREIDPLELTASGFAVFGEDTPALVIEQNGKLSAVRDFFTQAFGAVSTYPDFKPHLSLSYKWSGTPALEGLPLPPFPLVFNRLIVTELDDKPAVTGDAKAKPQTVGMFSDASVAAIAGTRRTADGYLVAEARCARTGIQDYNGFECGKPEMKTVRVYRPADEVFSQGALASYAFRPVTMGHPPEGVTADNWKQEAVGTTGGEITRDGGYVRVPLVLMDAAAIEAVESGIREISMGYECRLDWTSGTTADGEAYDAVQRGLRMNHLAMVEKGRAGAACRVGDSATPQNGAPTAKDENNMKLVVDGITYEVSDQAAELVKKLQADAATLATKVAEATAAADTATKARDAALGEAAATAAKVPTAAALDALVAERSAVIAAAKTLVPDAVTTGKTLSEIRADAVKAKLGDGAVTGRSADYIAAAFDTLTRTNAGRDPVADALRAGDTGGAKVNAADAARTKCLSEQADAWKSKAA